MEKNILEMEAPTFTTLSRVGSAALQECSWDVKADIIGDKVLCPMIHCCELCDKPILIYGRMVSGRILDLG
jgi:E3 ubiquitin-protein ligase Hakai